MENRSIETVLVTGGADVISSHLVNALYPRSQSLRLQQPHQRNSTNIKPRLNDQNLTFTKGDPLTLADLRKLKNNHHELVFHLAANPEVRVGLTNSHIHFLQNIVATHNLLEHPQENQKHLHTNLCFNLKIATTDSYVAHIKT